MYSSDHTSALNPAAAVGPLDGGKQLLDLIIIRAHELYPGFSDVNLTPGRPAQVEQYGALEEVCGEGIPREMTPEETVTIAESIIQNRERLQDDLKRHGSCDTSYSCEGYGRYRVNIFRTGGAVALVMRKLQENVPSIRDIGLPPIFEKISQAKDGLVLVTGSTGSGKTTTLSAILRHINETRKVHIVTLEDPIEFVHKHIQSTVNQRALGDDFDAFGSGLRAALRQAPKVILVGEMRDRETVEAALSAAETGHLVFSTLHTIDAGQTISRLLGFFSRDEEPLIRTRLSEVLRYVVSQRLAPRADGKGRALIQEIMGSSLRTREAIRIGERDGATFHDIIRDSETFGWLTFDSAVIRAYSDGIISEETAIAYATRKAPVEQQINMIKNRRGAVEQSSGLTLNLSSLEENHPLRILREGPPPLPPGNEPAPEGGKCVAA